MLEHALIEEIKMIKENIQVLISDFSENMRLFEIEEITGNLQDIEEIEEIRKTIETGNFQDETDIIKKIKKSGFYSSDETSEHFDLIFQGICKALNISYQIGN